jgi:hypothetical protein
MAATAALKARRERWEKDDVRVMVEFSKLIARVQCDEFWETTAETGTTDFFVSNYQVIYGDHGR